MIHLITKNNWGLELLMDPYAHQAKELELHWGDFYRALPWAMRTGKSMVVVVSAAGLWQAGQIDVVIILAPSRVHHAWAIDEFPRHCAVPFIAHSWNCRADRDHPLRQAEALVKLRGAPGSKAMPVLCVNREALLVPRVWKIVRAVAERNRTFFAVDESHHYGGAGTKGTMRLRALANLCEYRRILSGTMVGNSPGRLYSQFQVLEEGALGYDTADAFIRAHGHREFDGRVWRPVKGVWNKLDVLRERICQWGRPVLRSDCQDLPPVVSSREYFELSPRAMSEYDDAYLEAQETDPKNWMPARKAAMVGKDEALRELLPDRLQEGPVIVWAPFRETVNGVAGILQANGFPATAHHGGISTKSRKAAIRKAFEYNGVLVSTPDSLQEGADLSPARNMVWYAPPWNSVTFSQARERCTAMKGEATGEIQLCSKGTIEEVMYRCVEKKIQIEDYMVGEGLRQLMIERGQW